ncbi:AraC family transcriptional regulator [Sphingomonas sp. BN140010]|uniref:AraC family transcriptional regulator n=1 Tax=Sphingomonas arvum TaxID=2992113 RepID=A0ABT3JDT2_9SPHN|nr:AraC family transcriptional regulator [Sphingomonas sp. BN140010]MCW3797225.1 AraC family transcriptional regulator [Sphingomonas sp. BN140010]
MSQEPHVRPWFAKNGQLDRYATFDAGSSGDSSLVVAQVVRENPDFGLTVPNSPKEEYLGSLFLGDWKDADVWVDGKAFLRSAAKPNSFGLFDLRRCWVTNLIQPFSAVHFHIPSKLFDELAQEFGLLAMSTLSTPFNPLPHDEVMFHLWRTLLPALERPAQSNRLFADHITSAICIHLATTYGEFRLPDIKVGLGLAAWQERRAKELLLDDISANPSLTEVSQACGMSKRHFARCFKASTGLPPHRWLLHRRVELAKNLLESSNDSLADIAARCGFADQSHLSRVFRRLGLNSPRAWRAMMKVRRT